jgi:hypothetical protein
MVEVFTTNIQSKCQSEALSETLRDKFPHLRINFDLVQTRLPYPCGHSVLRVEGNEIDAESIRSVVHQSGFLCDILEDKVCIKN